MSRVVFVHWNCAEAEERAGRLRDAGYDVACHCDPKANPHALLASPPDAFVIDLARLPSLGRELGGFLRRSPVTRRVPLIFVEGAQEKKTGPVRALLPDAAFTTWSRARADVARALAAPPSEPVVPGAMAAYAGTPLTTKLGVTRSSVLLLLGAPDGFEKTIAPLPAGACISRQGRKRADIVLLFAHSQDALAASFDGATARVQDGGRLWILWRRAQRKNAEGRLTQNVVRSMVLARGWVDYKVSAIDETWSGLCFARRRPLEKEST